MPAGATLRTPDPSLRNELFEFEPVDLRITDEAVVKYGSAPDARRIMRFTMRDPAHYAQGMTEITAGLLVSLGKSKPNLSGHHGFPATAGDSTH